MNIEELCKKLVFIASKPVLSKAEHHEARRLMCELKRSGMSNIEISKLSSGKWSESTVKGYTKGVSANESASWQDAVEVLNDLMRRDRTLSDVDRVLRIMDDLAERGISLDDVADVLSSAVAASIAADTVVEQLSALNKAGLSVAAIREAMELKNQLEQQGLWLDSFSQIAKVAGTFSTPERVIEAISAYGSLNEIQTEMGAASNQLDGLNKELASVEQKVEGKKTEMAKLDEPIQAYKKALRLGFGEEELLSVANLAEKHGGAKAVLSAVETYVDYAEILGKMEKTQSELAHLQRGVDTLDIKYSHLKTAVDMCDGLINRYKFGLDAIATIFLMAGKYGQPIDVLKAIEAFGAVGAITDKLGRLQGQVEEKEKLLHKLEGEYQGALEQVEALSAKCMNVGAEVSKVETRCENSRYLLMIFNFVNEPAKASYNEHIPVVLALARPILKWVESHQRHFPFPHNIKSGLEALITQLGDY